MAAGFLPGSAGSFERTTRIVEPDIAAGNHLARDVHVIILDEDEAAFEFAVFAKVNDVLDETLAFIVARMGFAGEDELNRALRVLRELHDVFELLEDQRSALVSRETAREADRERIGAQQLID